MDTKFPKITAANGIGKIGGEVLNLSIGILINICAKLNICALNAPTSPIPKRYLQVYGVRLLNKIFI